MRRVIAGTFAIIFFVTVAENSHAYDFGALFKAELSAEGRDGTEAGGKTTLAPWLSLPLGNGGLYLSAGLGVHYAKKTVFVPELLRAEYSRQFAPFAVRAGRIPWVDPSALAARGLFDGADLSMDLGPARLGVAALYTGLLYKDTANVNISPGDPVDYGLPLDWGDFTKTYFAPRRILMALYGDLPGFPQNRGNLYAGLLFQFDVSEAEQRLHTQYLLLRHTLDYQAFDLSVAGAVELENTRAGGVKAALALSLDGGVQIPVDLSNRLSLGMRWASGSGSQTAAFFPVINEAQGLVLKPGFSGIMVLRTNFEARLLPILSAGLGGRYFLRTDSSSFSDPDITKDSHPVGAEIFASVLCVPFSDLSFTLEGGLFLPKTGTAMRDDAPVRWSLTLGTLFSF